MRFVKTISVLFLLGFFWAFGLATEDFLAAASPVPFNTCTPNDPNPGYQQVCTGWGQSCNVYSLACSTTPEPGKWGPEGYIPKVG